MYQLLNRIQQWAKKAKGAIRTAGFRQNRAWIELKKIWQTKKKVKGFQINKIEGGYSVAIAGFITFLPFKLKKAKKKDSECSIHH